MKRIASTTRPSDRRKRLAAIDDSRQQARRHLVGGSATGAQVAVRQALGRTAPSCGSGEPCSETAQPRVEMVRGRAG